MRFMVVVWHYGASSLLCCLLSEMRAALVKQLWHYHLTKAAKVSLSCGMQATGESLTSSQTRPIRLVFQADSTYQ